MKKYRLIKEYPGSPKLGTIQSGSKENERFYPTEKCMENNPEFWQEVKDFPKIVAFREIRNGKLYLITSEGYQDYAVKDYYPLEKMLKGGSSVEDEFCEIYQVQVESGEIFTIGDKIRRIDLNKEEIRIIEKFWIKSEIMYIKCINGSNLLFSEIEKVKEPLFVTEDSVEIFEGNCYYFVSNDFILCKGVAEEYGINNKLPRFSRQKYAEEWIDENRPKFSIKQIDDALIEYDPDIIISIKTTLGIL